MGGQDEQANIATNMVTNSLQQVGNYCSITCNNNISNQDIIIIGGNATIDLSQSCSAVGAECMIKNLLNTQVKNLIDNIVQQKESNLGIYSLLGPSSNESTNITSSIKNQVSQLINNACAHSVNNTDTNNTVFAQDANLNLTFAQTGNINNAQCALDTVAKMVINNSVKNSVSQTESSCGDVILILIIIVVVCVIILIWPILRALSKRAASTIEPKGGKTEGGTTEGGTTEGGTTEGGTTSIFSKTWFKVLLAVVGALVLGAIIYFVVKDHNKSATINNTGDNANNSVNQ
jgi:hypothetical protein